MTCDDYQIDSTGVGFKNDADIGTIYSSLGSTPTKTVMSRGFWSVGMLAAMSTSNPSQEALDRFATYFQEGTSPLPVAIHQPVRAHVHQGVTVSVSDRLVDILRYLGMTKTQLKDVCGVSRQTLYDWLAEKFEPDAQNASRLRQIHHLALLIPQRALAPLKTSTLREPVWRQKSLLELLQEPYLDASSLENALLAAAAKTSASRDRSAKVLHERRGFRPLSEAQQASNQDYNLESIAED